MAVALSFAVAGVIEWGRFERGADGAARGVTGSNGPDAAGAASAGSARGASARLTALGGRGCAAERGAAALEGIGEISSLRDGAPKSSQPARPSPTNADALKNHDRRRRRPEAGE